MKGLLVFFVLSFATAGLSQNLHYGLVRKNYYTSVYDPFFQMNVETFDSATVRMAQIDPTTGYVENIGSFTVNDGINLTGAALNPYDSTYIFLGFNDIRSFNINTGNLVSSVPLSNPIAPSYFDNFRFNNADSLLYGLARRNIYIPSSQVYEGEMFLATVNPTTGIISQISPTSVGQGFALAGSAIDPYQMVYYFSNGLELVGLDLYTGLVYSSPEIVKPADVIAFDNFTYNCEDNTIYGLARSNYYSLVYDPQFQMDIEVLDSSAAHLASIDPNSGIVTIISPTPLSSNSYSVGGGATIDPTTMTYYYNTGSHFVGVSLLTGLETSQELFNFEDGTYFDMVRNIQNCATASPRRLNPMANVNEGKNSDLDIYPNPFTNEFLINAPVEINSVQIYSMDGRKVYEREADGASNQLLIIPQLESGSYSVVINNTTYKKVVRF